MAYLDDEDIDSYGRPCGILYLKELFLSDFILLPFGNLKTTVKNNEYTNDFEKNNQGLSKIIGLYNIELN